MPDHIPENQKTCPVCSVRLQSYYAYHSYRYLGCPDCKLVATLPLPAAETNEAHYRSKFETGNYQLLRSNAERY